MKRTKIYVALIMFAAILFGEFVTGFVTTFAGSIEIGVCLLAMFVVSFFLIVAFADELPSRKNDVVYVSDNAVARNQFLQVHKKWKDKDGALFVCDETTFVKADNVSRIDIDTIATRLYVNEDGGRFIHVAESPEQLFTQLDTAYADRHKTISRASKEIQRQADV